MIDSLKPCLLRAIALCRVYASVHLLALYAAMCGSLPGLEVLQRPELEPLLRLIGAPGTWLSIGYVM